MDQAVLEKAAHDLPALPGEVDWAHSPLGAIGAWDPALTFAVDLMLHSESAMFLVWGAERIFLYNDAYLPVLGAKHPQALGRPMAESWSEVWDEVSVLLERSFAGKPLKFREHPFTILRNGAPEQAWFDFSYSPVFGADRKVGGVLCIVSEATRRVQAERALKRQAGTLQQLFEETPGFMALLRGPAHVFELANNSYRELIGGRDPVGKPVRSALPELAEQGFFELLDQVYRSGERFVGRRVPVSLQHAAATGPEQRWVDFIYQPVLDADGGVDGVFVQGTDVTHHVQTELALQEAAARAASERDRLNVLLDTVPAGIGIVDEAGRLVGANAGMKAIWGDYPQPAGVHEYQAWKGWWPDGAERQGLPLEPDEWPIVRALRGERHARSIVEIEPFGVSSGRRVVLMVATALRGAAGNMAGALVAQTDITDQVRAETALRDSELKFRVIANSIPHLVWSNLPDGTHDFFNDEWHAFTGLDGMRAKDEWESIVHPDDRELAASRWAASLASGAAYEIEYRLLHRPSGAFRWCLSRAVPVRDAGGRLIRWLGTCTDVHEQRTLTDELRRAADKKDEFLAMLAHELRNPLAPIRAAADLLKIGGPDPQRQAKAVSVIDRQVRHMTELVDDLLDVSRVTRGLVELEHRPVDLKSVVAGAVEQARPLIEARGHTLQVHIDAEHASALGDATRLVQVVVNLLSNAAKYTPRAGAIEVSVTAHADWVRIAVQDNGSGIDAGLLPHVFDIFTQGVRTPDRSEGGLGIGLALVKSLVALHGGSVAAHSEGPGQGSRFEIQLPALRAGAGAGEAASSNAAAGRPVSGKRILLVDDNADAVDSLAQLLEVLGHEVRVSFDGAGALAAAAAFQPEAFVLDVGLPDINGYELARRLKAGGAPGGSLFIALTGYGQAHDRVLSRAAGFHHHFVKPVDIAALCGALGEARPAP